MGSGGRASGIQLFTDALFVAIFAVTLAAALRRPGWPNVDIAAFFGSLALTAAENAQRWADSIKADAFVAKPFEIDDLLAAVARHKRDPGERRH